MIGMFRAAIRRPSSERLGTVGVDSASATSILMYPDESRDAGGFLSHIFSMKN